MEGFGFLCVLIYLPGPVDFPQTWGSPPSPLCDAIMHHDVSSRHDVYLQMIKADPQIDSLYFTLLDPFMCWFFTRIVWYFVSGTGSHKNCAGLWFCGKLHTFSRICANLGNPTVFCAQISVPPANCPAPPPPLNIKRSLRAGLFEMILGINMARNRGHYVRTGLGVFGAVYIDI